MLSWEGHRGEPDALTAHVRFWEGAKLNRSSSKLYAKLERESPLYSPEAAELDRFTNPSTPAAR
jgi:hypothetical protein